MDPITPKSLILGIVLWIGYFTTVAVVCHMLYVKLRGEPPQSRNLTVMIEGKPVSALTQWAERDRRLQRFFLAVAGALVLFPLFLPWFLRE